MCFGGTTIQTPTQTPIDVYQSTRDYTRGLRESVPDIIATEQALRGPLQQLALQDYQTALFGGASPAMTRERDRAEQAFNQATQQRQSAESDLQSRIDEIEGREFSAEGERERLRSLRNDYLGFIGDTDRNTSISDEEKENIKNQYRQTIETIEAELEFSDDQLTERFGQQFKDKQQRDLEVVANELNSLKESGDLSDASLASLEQTFNTAADAVLEENPGILELSQRAVESQFELGEKLKKAAANNEFETISELAPELVDMYKNADPASRDLANIATQRAEQLSTGEPTQAQKSLSELATRVGARDTGVGGAQETLQAAGANLGQAQDALGNLAQDVSDRTIGGQLGESARAGAQELMGREAMGQTADQQTVAGQIQQLLQGPQAGQAEQRLLEAAGQGPSAAEQRLLEAAGRPASAEAQALSQFGQQALQGGQRAASDVEQTLQQQALQQLGFQAAGASPEEQALQQRIGGLIDSAGTLSPTQQRQIEQEALALGQRQGRVRDTSTAAGVAGRLSEARRADESQDLMAAQQLLGQQQAMQQARTAEELQRMGMGGQFAGQSEALAQQRLAEERALQQMGVGATGTAAQLGAQQAGLSQQALQGAGSLEQARMGQQLQGTGLAQDIAQAGFATDMAGREQQLREFGVGAQEAARFAQQQAQQDTMRGQLIGQQAGLAGQQAAFAGQEARLAGQQFAQQAQQDAALANLFGQQFGMGQQREALQGQALGQAFGMQRGMAPDIGAFFGRPASQAAGLQVLGMGQQQAQYGTSPQAFDPMGGVNLALQQQANQTNLDIGAMSANAQQRGGLFSGLGQIGAAAIQFCWVAREVYGQNNPMWLLFRGWLLDEAPSWFRKIYIKYGERFARFISNKPFIKSFIRKWMTSIVKKYYK